MPIGLTRKGVLMIRLMIFIVSLYLFSGCGVIKHTLLNKEKKESSKAAVGKQKTSQQINRSELLLVIDTSNKLHYLEIKPIGAFTFSVDKGFSGTAEYVRFSRKDVALRKVLLAKQTKEKVLAKAALSIKKSEKQDKVEKKIQLGRINGLWLVIIAIAALLLYRLFFTFKY